MPYVTGDGVEITIGLTVWFHTTSWTGKDLRQGRVMEIGQPHWAKEPMAKVSNSGEAGFPSWCDMEWIFFDKDKTTNWYDELPFEDFEEIQPNDTLIANSFFRIFP